jgi:hypothetical protein
MISWPCTEKTADFLADTTYIVKRLITLAQTAFTSDNLQYWHMETMLFSLSAIHINENLDIGCVYYGKTLDYVYKILLLIDIDYMIS